jgi:hypothetical protein
MKEQYTNQHRRWYDKDPVLSQAMETLEHSNDETQIKVALNLIKIIIEHNIEDEQFEAVEDIINAVDLLERRPEETFLQYVERASNSEYAKDIIKAGIYNALDIASLNKINDDTVKMLNENLEALHYLESIPSEE